MILCSRIIHFILGILDLKYYNVPQQTLLPNELTESLMLYTQSLKRYEKGWIWDRLGVVKLLKSAHTISISVEYYV